MGSRRCFFWNIIGEKYSFSTFTDALTPAGPAGSISLTISPTRVLTTSNVAPGETSYYRFWLDVPAGTATGTFTNDVIFTTQLEGTVC